ncbi:SMI1/KNR4 family protein [Halalkalibacter alkaliphilus]|uniref:SMI1/KNR4 family protein n=1 Tax=Halalkalibacter alkaliphilus TaxID=2917993 RepID=A0A9X2I7U2_9BACI|nr:SMI1/KNR4 family protein [Halalkalibacter alkaliphilus]MCL7749378.1 SMI1/KNR4 family protein [Halalkalibacter alkaliphilus]
MSLQFYNGTNFWKSPSGYKPGEQVTNAQVAEVEQLLGISLPRKYVELMQEQNGGELAYRYVLFEDGDAAVVPYFHELEMDRGVGLSLIFVEECGLPDHLVLLTGDFHSWIALDYRNGRSEPAVLYITEDESGNGLWQEHIIAENFDQFLGRLFQK